MKFFNKIFTRKKAAAKGAIVLTIISLILLCLWIFTCFPVLSRTVLALKINENNFNKSFYKKENDSKDILLIDSGEQNIYIINLEFKKPVIAKKSDYLVVTMTAKNTGNVEYPEGSFSVKLDSYKVNTLNSSDFKSTDKSHTIQNDKLNYAIYDRTKFYIDGIKHSYYVAVGQNKFYINSFALGSKVLKKEIKTLVIEFPNIDGVKLDIEKIEFKQRTFFALDSLINYFLKNYLNISHINRYITPVYVFILLISAIYIFYRLILKSKFNKILNSSLSYTLLALVLFSAFYFIAANNFYTVKSYWDCYKKYLICRNCSNIYYGFYNFEKFIYWLDKILPAEENLTVLVNGQPVYIMAEMVYNLYPRDIKFIDAGLNNPDKVIKELEKLNMLENKSYSYRYLVILSDKNIINSEKLKFISSYRKTGGFLYFFNN